MRSISSRHNPLVADCRELAAHPDAAGARVFLDGAHLVREALAAGVEFDAAIASRTKCAPSRKTRAPAESGCAASSRQSATSGLWRLEIGRIGTRSWVKAA